MGRWPVKGRIIRRLVIYLTNLEAQRLYGLHGSFRRIVR